MKAELEGWGLHDESCKRAEPEETFPMFALGPGIRNTAGRPSAAVAAAFSEGLGTKVTTSNSLEMPWEASERGLPRFLGLLLANGANEVPPWFTRTALDSS